MTAFITHHGLHRSIKIAFRLRSALETFQRTMDVIRSSVKGQFALVYLDDIMIFSNTLEQHFKHVREVLQLLNMVGATLRL